jgi:hypothetical protein
MGGSLVRRVPPTAGSVSDLFPPLEPGVTCRSATNLRQKRGRCFPFVAQHRDNAGGNQNFKLVAWPRIAKALGLTYGSSVLTATAATPVAYAMGPTLL